MWLCKLCNSTCHRPMEPLLRKLLRYKIALALLFFLKFLGNSVADQQLPQDSTYYYVGCYTARADLLKEPIKAKTPQSCLEICEHQKYIYAILSAERCYCSNVTNEEERQYNQLCNTRCLANKSQYCGGVGVHSYYATIPLDSAIGLYRLQVSNTTEHSLTIKWEANLASKVQSDMATSLLDKNQITNFLIKSQVVKTFSSQPIPVFTQPEFIVQGTERRFEITDLNPATEYNVTVTAMCNEKVCGTAYVQGITDIGIPAPAPKEPVVLEKTNHTIKVKISPIKNINGPVTKLLIIVERVDESLSQTFDETLLADWRTAQEDGSPYYIAGELDYSQPEDNQIREFIVGDGKRYGMYSNPPLDNEETTKHIHVSLGVVSTLNGITKTLYAHSTHAQHTTDKHKVNDFTYATFESGHESIIALSLTCIIFAIFLVLSLITYFYLRYKTYQTRSSNVIRRRNAHEMTMQEPIIERENNGFIVEDEALPTTLESFKEELNKLISTLDSSKRLPRNVIRMNVNNIVAEGVYGEVITGKLISSAALGDLPNDNADCQLHVLSLDDLTVAKDQARLLQDVRNLTRLQKHENILDFYGISASADWFYIVFEHQTVSLKRRLIESRRAPSSATVQRLTSLSEELVLQWIYEIASAMEYLGKCKIVHKQLCSHNIYVTDEMKLKVMIFGPIPYANANQQKIDISRWLAPESLRYQHYSTKSDIWSFACVAWECSSLGATPFANITRSQLLLDAIKSGSRPAQPSFVYRDLYQLFLNCWQLEPSERILFEDIAYNVRQLMTSPRHALCFDRVPEMPGTNVVDILPYYLPMLETLN